MSRTTPIGVGVIGLGFMGRTHIAAYRAADAAGWRNRLVAVCDPSAERRAGLLGSSGNSTTESRTERSFDPAQVKSHVRAEDLFDDRAVELVSICTHTDTHVDLAIRALQAGKHVLVEKPVALRAADVERLAAAAERAHTLCMPAMCMRFWPGWDWMRARVVERTFGAVESAVFQRLGARPAWSPAFYGDFRRSGGALFDLHIHDADFVRWCFGAPTAVMTSGTLEHATTQYRFARGPAHVTAEGGWIADPSFPFQMRARLVFESATADFDFAREPRLLLTRANHVDAVVVDETSGYDGEVRHLLEVIDGTTKGLRVNLTEAVELARLVESERESLQRSAAIAL